MEFFKFILEKSVSEIQYFVTNFYDDYQSFQRSRNIRPLAKRPFKVALDRGGITNDIMKHNAYNLIEPLCQLFNFMLAHAKIPDSEKIILLMPVCKCKASTILPDS